MTGFYLLFVFCYIIQHSGFIKHIFYGDVSSAVSKFTLVNWF